jgi:hypothetical protein
MLFLLPVEVEQRDAWVKSAKSLKDEAHLFRRREEN